ncbi:MAG TPA: hypothetical protein PLD91_19120 [Spirochaetota bacterium]|nr:hypothetical protein [Spirochaetota bacterium]
MKEYKLFYEPIDGYERELIALEKFSQKENITLIDHPRACDLCGSPFENRRFMIDACLDPKKNPWGFVCAECFFKLKLTIGWGKGQLYIHLKNGSWFLTAGL